MEHVVIIGNGVSGVTCARHVRKRSDARISIISSETDHFFSRTALMYIYMGHMRYEDTKPYEDWFWEKNRIELVRGHVTAVDYQDKSMQLADGRRITYDKLVLALGSKPNKFGWPGQDLEGVQGLYSMQDLETLERNTAPRGDVQPVKRAVIVGGGLIGIELAEMLMSRGIPVTFLVREQRFWGNVLPAAESDLVMREMRQHGVDLRLGAELDEIIASDQRKVARVRCKDGTEIECQLVGLTAGVSPNIAWLKDSDLETDRGILVDPYLETNQAGVYAIGDCAQFRSPVAGRRALEQVWYTGRIMGESLALTLTGQSTAYQPGHWFNSAKFFDREYQTYGWVFPEAREGEAHFYWEHPAGQHCVRINYATDSGQLIGINTFGIRMRHEIIDRWLSEKRDVDYVLAHLRDANFDPEFYKKYEGDICAAFTQETGRKINLKKRSLKRIFG